MRHSLRFWLVGLTAAVVLAACSRKNEGPMMLMDEAPPAADRPISKDNKPTPFPDEPADVGAGADKPAQAMLDDETDPSRKANESTDKPQPLASEPAPQKNARE